MADPSLLDAVSSYLNETINSALSAERSGYRSSIQAQSDGDTCDIRFTIDDYSVSSVFEYTEQSITSSCLSQSQQDIYSFYCVCAFFMKALAAVAEGLSNTDATGCETVDSSNFIVDQSGASFSINLSDCLSIGNSGGTIAS